LDEGATDQHRGHPTREPAQYGFHDGLLVLDRLEPDGEVEDEGVAGHDDVRAGAERAFRLDQPDDVTVHLGHATQVPDRGIDRAAREGLLPRQGHGVGVGEPSLEQSPRDHGELRRETGTGAVAVLDDRDEPATVHDPREEVEQPPVLQIVFVAEVVADQVAVEAGTLGLIRDLRQPLDVVEVALEHELGGRRIAHGAPCVVNRVGLPTNNYSTLL